MGGKGSKPFDPSRLSAE